MCKDQPDNLNEHGPGMNGSPTSPTNEIDGTDVLQKKFCVSCAGSTHARFTSGGPTVRVVRQNAASVTFQSADAAVRIKNMAIG